MISIETETQIRTDYYQSDDQNTLMITADEAENFWTWFQQNAIPMQSIVAAQAAVNEHYGPGECFHNAQTEALLHGIPYYEGFFVVNQHNYLHAYNGINGQALDVTAINNRNIFRQANGEMPVRYYGIEIPHGFINGNCSNACLLRQYFLFVTNPEQ